MRRQAVAAVLALAVAAAAAAAEPSATVARGSAASADVAYTYSAAPFVADFEPPEPGTYELPPIARLADHRLLGSNGQPVQLAAAKRGRLAVVAFIYTTCSEAAGCPLAEAILQRVDRRLAEDPALARQVRLMTISFDPERDTPARMAQVRDGYQPRTDWLFLTAPDEAALQPVLADFGQPVAKLRYADGTWTGLYRHVLKVFLLDEQNNVRNIYSTGMVSPEIIIADLRTLAMASDGARAAAVPRRDPH
jgi:cytochrome c peroxidase